MSISVMCLECGRGFKAKDEHAGRRTKCPSCGAPLDIPGGEPFTLPGPSGETIAALGEAVEPEPIPAGDALMGLLGDIREMLAVVADHAQSRNAASSTSQTGPRQYKVLTQKDKWFSGKFDPEKLEQAVNAYAAQGWTVKGITTASIPGFGGNRDELIVLLER